MWYEGHFAIEYKGLGKDLRAAYNQLLQYRENLKNPPLLIVTDIQNWEIHTNFTNSEPVTYTFRHEDLIDERNLRLLRAMFEAPEKLDPKRTTAEVTADVADNFKNIVETLRDWEYHPERIARFLTKLIFCLYAEDIGLLPESLSGSGGVFSEIVERSQQDPNRFVRYLHDLFEAMRTGGDFLLTYIPYFNGSLFDDVEVEPLTPTTLQRLKDACSKNWSAVDPTIFGTLFERTLDPRKRAQLGAHYTSKDDIKLIIEPVLMQPLRREWQTRQAQAEPVRAAYENAQTPRDKMTAERELIRLRGEMLERLRTVTVLDPACGSGNFLYIALQSLLDLEKEVINHPLWDGLPTETPRVHPRQLYGIEKDEIAHALASIVVWIGYIQWRERNGYPYRTEPILEDLRDNIRCMDAILALDENGQPIEPEWPAVDVIVSNPPFLGGNYIRQELGDYVDRLFELYEGRVPAFADLVCYWFERARIHIENGTAKRVGLLSTNSIRGGANREVLKRIKNTGNIFMAWSDRDWILDGAAVRVSMIGFDNGDQKSRTLDGSPVESINSDLTSGVDITKANNLTENTNISFQGPSPKGSFDIPSDLATEMLRAVNTSGKTNAEVVKPVLNAADIVRRSRNYWTIDFGAYITEAEAAQYEKPFDYVKEHVYPERKSNNRAAYRERWWLYAEPRVGMREALRNLSRYVATPRVAKHRIFIWVTSNVLCNDGNIVFAREDDYFFGVLHSRLHEVWSLRMGTSLEDRPRYTPTTTFETFPFPYPPGKEPTPPLSPLPVYGEGLGVGSEHYLAIAAAAKQLHEERHAWLNPPNAPESALKKRTLTNLYNALAVFRGREKISVPTEAANFAPRLAELHRALDEAVCAAYGWDVSILEDEEAILRELLALNLARAGN